MHFTHFPPVFHPLQTQLDAKLEYVMRNHTNVLARVEVKAPLVIIAGRGDVHGHKEDLLLIDLGHIVLTTEKLAKLAAAETLLHDIDDDRSHYSSASTPSRHLDLGLGGDLLSPDTPALKGWGRASQRSGRKSRRDAGSRRGARSHKSSIPSLSHSQHTSQHTSDVSAGGGGGRVSRSRSLISDDADDGDAANTAPDTDAAAGADGTDADADADPDRSGLDDADDDRAHTHNDNDGGGGREEEEEEEEDELLFDIFQLAVSQVEVYMVRGDELWRSFSSEQIAQRSIVDRFDIAMEIQVSTILYDTTLPPIKLFLDLPELVMRLSESKVRDVFLFRPPSRDLVSHSIGRPHSHSHSHTNIGDPPAGLQCWASGQWAAGASGARRQTHARRGHLPDAAAVPRGRAGRHGCWRI